MMKADLIDLGEGELKEKVRSEVLQAAALLGDRDYVRKIVLQEAEKTESHPLLGAVWDDLSLSHGLPGLCILFGQLDRLDPDGGYDEIGHQYMLDMKARIDEEGIQQLSLWGGLAGILMGAKALSRDRTRYTHFIDQMLNLFTNHYKLQLDASVEAISSGGDMFHYDVIQGWSGMGRCLLHFIDQPHIRKAVEDILEYCVLLAQPKTVNGQLVPGWHIPSRFLIHEHERELYPNGLFNCGLSHGIPGVLAFLSLSYEQGVIVQGHKEAIETITGWLIQWASEDEYGLFWPASISWEEQITNTYLREPKSREAWCYGSPGVARSLWLAGTALDQPEWKDTALSAMLATFKRPLEQWNLFSPIFCHGWSGLLQITNRMWRESGHKDLQRERGRLIQLIFESYQSDAPFGYTDVVSVDGKFIEVSKPGLLEGLAGITLALLDTVFEPGDDWDSVFLIK
ncbi:lanthionine synthetase C family protein [Paenibacillus faecalis]|uniref:lanthionine synthetase C family protein n=1 Tax=Paenibacillus faecalis TaxID=2079532 RepID=UPI000D0EC730|nr:lanthionine synthetase C family protein [Paenibacillus faecalis]